MPLPDAAAIGLVGAGAGAAPFAALLVRAARRARAGEAKTALLRGAMECTPCNFAVYDRDRFMAACNESYRALHREAFRTLRAPIRHDDLMRIAVAATVPAGQVEADLAARIAKHQGVLDRPWDRLYPGGRWMRIDKRRPPGGAAGDRGAGRLGGARPGATWTRSRARRDGCARSACGWRWTTSAAACPASSTWCACRCGS